MFPRNLQEPLLGLRLTHGEKKSVIVPQSFHVSKADDPASACLLQNSVSLKSKQEEHEGRHVDLSSSTGFSPECVLSFFVLPGQIHILFSAI